MTIQQCKYVLEIAQAGSFNEAAKRLFLAQSSLSFSIKSLEEELGIKIFQRSENGTYLTEDGMDFVRYASQMTEQYDFILQRFTQKEQGKKLFVTTQHYDFVADIFGRLMNEITAESFQLSLHEMKTYEVIRETETAYCDIGILALKRNDVSTMERYLNKSNLQFKMICEAKPHIYIRNDHKLANCSVITPELLKNFPYVSYEQGKHSVSFFAEEIIHTCGDKRVEISDRASLMNVLLATDSYTVGTGIMPSLLNDGRIISIPFESNDSYFIGYILRKDRDTSDLTNRFIEILEKELTNL